MHLQENTFMTLTMSLGQSHTKCYPVPSSLCDILEATTSNSLEGDGITKQCFIRPSH